MTSVCLINPPTTDPGQDQVYFPMSLICLGTVLKARGIPVTIVDLDKDLKQFASGTKWSLYKHHTLKRLGKKEAPIFGISSICSNYPVALLLAREIRQRWPLSKIILGGPQPSAVAEETLKVCPWIDVIAVGEGEETIVALANCDWSEESLENIKGIVFKKAGQIHRTERRPLMKHLDDLPLPDFSLIPLSDYLEMDSEVALIEAGRGCPFLCSFCSTALMWEREFRMKSPARVLEEMRALQKSHGLKSFGLTHDNFTTSHSTVDDFCDYFQKNNHEKFAWSVSSRPDTLNRERLQKLRASECRGLFFGVDTGSARIQKVIHKNLNLDHFREVLRESVSLGIEATTSLIIGFTEETVEDINQTLLLGLEAKLSGSHIVQFHPLAPLAGTAICNDNPQGLVWKAGSVDLTIQPLFDPEIDTWIGTHRDLFSFFYTVPTPHLGSLNILILSIFFDGLTRKIPTVLKRVLETTDWQPSELFLHWMDWREKCHPTDVVDDDFIIGTFPNFLRASLLKSYLPGLISCQSPITF